GHGDGLGPGDHGYKLIKRIFANRAAQRLFARIHPNTCLRLMKLVSGRSRQLTSEEKFLGPEPAWLIRRSLEVLEQELIDYFIYGQRHLPIDYLLGLHGARYINLGDWISHNSYAEFDGVDVSLRYYGR